MTTPVGPEGLLLLTRLRDAGVVPHDAAIRPIFDELEDPDLSRVTVREDDASAPVLADCA